VERNDTRTRGTTNPGAPPFPAAIGYDWAMPDRLERYREKRDPEATPEPAGDAHVPPAAAGAPRFVVQEHHARRLHWDLRLEHEGTLASWAVPRGIPPGPERNHLAVRTEDHPLEYLEFHGEIPAGQYGAGTMKIWDRGTYDVHKFREDEVMVTFHGERVRGRYVLFRTRGDDWMIHRMDPPEDPEREPMPDQLAPMLARTGPLPRDDEHWAFEIKWDGVRAIAFVQGGSLKLQARTGRDVTSRYPELRPIAQALAGREVVLDGEVVAFDGTRPSFQKLQGRMHLTSEHAVRRLAREDPVHYIAFDLLYLDGRSLIDLRYDERRAKLAELELQGPTWQAPAHHVGDGAALLELTRAQQLEGVIAKRLDSPYLPGRRTSGWVKVKNVATTDVVIGGWLSGEGNRSGRLGALVIGIPDDEGALRYAGRVGTGFNQAELVRLGGLLESLASAESPFVGRQPPKLTQFVEPRLVARVEFSERTQGGTLRQPSYKGLRDDVAAQDVRFG
jgi:bifunctional non-homologous end joining protein LigD